MPERQVDGSPLHCGMARGVPPPPRKLIVASHNPSPWAVHHGFREVNDTLSSKCLELVHDQYPTARAEWGLAEPLTPSKPSKSSDLISTRSFALPSPDRATPRPPTHSSPKRITRPHTSSTAGASARKSPRAKALTARDSRSRYERARLSGSGSTAAGVYRPKFIGKCSDLQGRSLSHVAQVDGGVQYDTSGDGSADAIALDTTGDGHPDSVGYDTTGDGKVDTLSVAVDSNGDGFKDTVVYDTTGDGMIDAVAIDATGDGREDSVAYDTTGDGRLDKIQKARKAHQLSQQLLVKTHTKGKFSRATVCLSPRIVTVDSGSPRLKLFCQHGQKLQLHKHGTTSNALLRQGGHGADGETGSLEHSTQVPPTNPRLDLPSPSFEDALSKAIPACLSLHCLQMLSKMASKNAPAASGALGSLRILRHWPREALSFISELWKEVHATQLVPVSSLNGARASKEKTYDERQENALYIGGFQELLYKIGCYACDDLARRLFRVMIYPPHMGHVAISQRPRTQLGFKQFVGGCRRVLGDSQKTEEDREKRLLCIFYFYDYDRLQYIDQGSLYRGLVYLPEYQVIPKEKRRLLTLNLVERIWKSLCERNDPSDWVKDVHRISRNDATV